MYRVWFRQLCMNGSKWILIGPIRIRSLEMVSILQATRTTSYLLFGQTLVHTCSNTLVLSWLYKLGSVAGPVIQANGRLEFEDGLRTGVLLHCVSRWTSVRTKLGVNMDTLGEPGVARLSEEVRFGPGETSSSSKCSRRAVVGLVEALWKAEMKKKFAITKDLSVNMWTRRSYCSIGHAYSNHKPRLFIHEYHIVLNWS